MFKMEYAEDFKQAVAILQLQVESGKFNYPDNWENGLCYMLSLYCDNAYDIVNSLLEVVCLSDYGTFTEERELFLEFMAYTLTAEDIYEICVDCWED